MPELPEVESVVRRIRPCISGQQIIDCDVRWSRTLGGISEKDFRKFIVGARVEHVSRRGKYIIVHLTPEGVIVIHLRMSGDIFINDTFSERDKHLRVALQFSDGTRLRFIDARKFGRCLYLPDPNQLLNRLGPEPIDPDLDLTALHQRMQRIRRPIKSVLLDQQIIAGLGNIYAIESLWRAKVHPVTPASDLSQKTLQNLMLHAAQVLQEAIEHQGTDLGDGVWKMGGFTPSVYGRAGLPCLRCGTKIKHMRLAQRGTDYCPRCQRS